MSVGAGPSVGVGAVVVRDGALLVIRRGRDPGRGLWSLPGGRVEHGEALVDAVRREVREETGLDVAVGELLGVYEVVGDDHHFVALDYVATVTGPDEPRPGDDVDAVKWVPLSDVAALECTPRFVETLAAWGVLPGTS
ncbi:MAG TPA: NUDIX hydrolase [Actinomycetota bacterium]|nr:NUDIX hydrolase [Actinomycetota bacterium]